MSDSYIQLCFIPFLTGMKLCIVEMTHLAGLMMLCLFRWIHMRRLLLDFTSRFVCDYLLQPVNHTDSCRASNGYTCRAWKFDMMRNGCSNWSLLNKTICRLVRLNLFCSVHYLFCKNYPYINKDLHLLINEHVIAGLRSEKQKVWSANRDSQPWPRTQA